MTETPEMRVWRRKHPSASTYIAVMVTVEFFVQLGQIVHHGGF